MARGGNSLRTSTQSIPNKLFRALTFKPCFGFRLRYSVAGPGRVAHPITEQRSGSDTTNDLWEAESIEPFVFHFRQRAKEAGAMLHAATLQVLETRRQK